MTKHLDGTDGTLPRTTTAFTLFMLDDTYGRILLTVERKASRYDQMIDRVLFNTKSRNNIFPYMTLVLRAVIGRYTSVYLSTPVLMV